jgi:hypothetical protein
MTSTPFLDGYDQTSSRRLWRTLRIMNFVIQVGMETSFQVPNPALYLVKRLEPVTFDIVHSDTAVMSVGKDTKFTNIYCIKSYKLFLNTLEDNIIQRGAPHKIISNKAQVIVRNKVQDILRTVSINCWQSDL